MLARTKPFGLYLHIPFCAALCTYCDFAKTANHDDSVRLAYLRQLTAHVQQWFATASLQAPLRAGLDSVFLGGGTPSLFTSEYAPLFAAFAAHLRPDSEVSLEANPDDITPAALAAWRGLGVNRLSIGVQTFVDAGLRNLGRVHSAADAEHAIVRALATFPKLNVDLIYGWQGQDLEQWRTDLDRVLRLGVPHLSLYSLTYEGRTPLARRAQRGVLQPASDEALADYYDLACAKLAAAGYVHEEVSNWSLPGHSCKHNWIYWQDAGYLGVGAGAHGYLPAPDGPGLRYAYPRQERGFTRHRLPVAHVDASSVAGRAREYAVRPSGAACSDQDDLPTIFGIELETGRDNDLWLTEVIGSGLRCARGVDLEVLQTRTARRFVPTPVLAEGLATGALTVTAQGRLVLQPREWFREISWGVELLRSMV